MLYFLILAFLASPWPVQSQKLNVILLAGQSNMAGRGGVYNDTKTHNLTWDGIIPAQCQSNPSIFRLSANLTWEEAHEPLHADIDVRKVNGIGPGMPFSNEVLTRDPSFGVIGLVPCAIGGTNISEWEKGAFLYQQLVKRAAAAVRGGGVYSGMLWYQGESDTMNKTDAESYKGRLERFFTDLRSDLQAPSLSIFQVALASKDGPYTDVVRKAQLGVDLANVHCIDAKGLALEPPEELHLTAASQVTLGQMLADSFLQSMNLSSSSSGDSINKRFSCFLFWMVIALWMNLLISL